MCVGVEERGWPNKHTDREKERNCRGWLGPVVLVCARRERRRLEVLRGGRSGIPLTTTMWLKNVLQCGGETGLEN